MALLQLLVPVFLDALEVGEKRDLLVLLKHFFSLLDPLGDLVGLS